MNDNVKLLTFIGTRYLDCYDEFFSKRNILPDFFDVEDVKSLTAFVTRSKTIREMDFFVIDLTDTLYSDEHILNSIQLLRRLSYARVIIIAPTGEDTDILFGKLLNFNIKNLIAADDDKKLLRELSMCLSENGKSFADSNTMKQNAMVTEAKNTVKPQITIPDDCIISAAVSGAMHRVGVTTQALAVYRYAEHLGFMPLVVDREQKMLGQFMQIYEGEVDLKETYMELKGINFAQDKITNDKFNFFIYDFGTLCGGNADEFLSSDIPVFVSGVKAFELCPLGELFNRYGLWEKDNIIKLFTFASDKDLETVKDYFKDEIFAVPYMPCFWDCSEFGFYNRVLLKRIKRLCDND